MKVLFITKNPQSERSGASLRDQLFLDFHEKNSGHLDVLSLTLNSGEKSVNISFNDKEFIVNLSRTEWYRDMVYNVLKGVPSLSARKYVNAGDYENNYDLVQVETPFLFELGREIAEKNNARLVFDEHNVEYDLVRQNRDDILGKWFSACLKKKEKKALQTADISFCCSEIDKEKLWNKPHVIPNAIDKDNYDLDAAKPSEYKKGKRALFLGSLSYEPNEEAAEIIINKIAPEAPTWDFYIVGRRPTEKVRGLAESRRNVKIIGEVEEIDPYIANVDICLAPIISGSGTRLKILEYLAFKKPVISTSKGKEGIDTDQITVADDFSDYGRLMKEKKGEETNIPQKYTKEEFGEEVTRNIF